MHPPVRRALIQALGEVFNRKAYTDITLDKTFKSHKAFGSRDRRALAESLYECVRHWRRFCHFVDLAYDKTEFSDADFEKVLDFQLSNKADLERPKDIEDKAWYSASDDLMDTFIDQLGLETGLQYLEAMNAQAPVFLRTNTIKINREELLRKLSQEGYAVKPVPDSEIAIELTERKNIFPSESFKSGYFEVQDVGSQKISEALAPQPGDRVIDACAGAGGKTLHLACLMKNKGRIISMDVHQRKLDQLRIRARRASVDIVETRLIDSTKVIKRLHETADRLLLDVPCSGSGVLRRNPDTKLRFNTSDLKNTMELQDQILSDYSKMLKPGGTMVYSTCSVFPCENQDRVDHFVTQNKTDYKLDTSFLIPPSVDLSDGFFIAVIKKS